MKHLYLLPLAALICACEGFDSNNNEMEPLEWGNASLCIEQPIAPNDSNCYQIDLKLDTLAGDSELARQLASMLRDSVLNVPGKLTIQESLAAFADSLEAEWKTELAELYDPEAEYKDMFQYYYNIDGSPIEKEQEDSILTYQTTIDCYLGGAHGSYIEMFYNFDKKTGKLLNINDIIPAEKEMLVLMAMEDQLCEDWQVENKEELQEQTGITLLGDLFLTNNFLLKNDSITFVFNQYEIAPYATGLVSVTLKRP